MLADISDRTPNNYRIQSAGLHNLAALLNCMGMRAEIDKVGHRRWLSVKAEDSPNHLALEVRTTTEARRYKDNILTELQWEGTSCERIANPLGPVTAFVNLKMRGFRTPPTEQPDVYFIPWEYLFAWYTPERLNKKRPRFHVKPAEIGQYLNTFANFRERLDHGFEGGNPGKTAI